MSPTLVRVSKIFLIWLHVRSTVPWIVDTSHNLVNHSMYVQQCHEIRGQGFVNHSMYARQCHRIHDTSQSLINYSILGCTYVLQYCGFWTLPRVPPLLTTAEGTCTCVSRQMDETKANYKAESHCRCCKELHRM